MILLYSYFVFRCIECIYCYGKKSTEKGNIHLTKEKMNTNKFIAYWRKKVYKILHANAVQCVYNACYAQQLKNILSSYLHKVSYACLYMSMLAVLFVSLLTLLVISHYNCRICLFSNYIFCIYSVYVHMYSCVACKYIIQLFRMFLLFKIEASRCFVQRHIGVAFRI